MERAFTGEYWWTNDVGHYECKACSQRLFMFDHKYINRSGYPTFWNCLENAVRFISDKLPINKVTNAHECPTLKGKKPIMRASCSNVSTKVRISHIFMLFSARPTSDMFTMTVLHPLVYAIRSIQPVSTLLRSHGSRYQSLSVESVTILQGRRRSRNRISTSIMSY